MPDSAREICCPAGARSASFAGNGARPELPRGRSCYTATVSPLRIAVIVFMALELANVAALYFAPGSKRFNAVGVFRAWAASEDQPDQRELLTYLAEWVAGVKLIVLGLLGVLVWAADERLLRLAVLVLVATTASFYWRMFPRIRRMDAAGQLDPRGYARTVGLMVGGFIVGLLLTLGLG